MAGFDLQLSGHGTSFGGTEELDVGEKEVVDRAMRFHSGPYFLNMLEVLGFLLLCSIWHLVPTDLEKIIEYYGITREYLKTEVARIKLR